MGAAGENDFMMFHRISPGFLALSVALILSPNPARASDANMADADPYFQIGAPVIRHLGGTEVSPDDQTAQEPRRSDSLLSGGELADVRRASQLREGPSIIEIWNIGKEVWQV